ncbi:hypothetical protein [Brucella intermedia]|uniref:hypothetical protein n=1 Tax=Brucella intermedia TaxID=94625 RepID=UPI00224A5D0B|nr:hypothetical protein [Brucella intermedia]
MTAEPYLPSLHVTGIVIVGDISIALYVPLQESDPPGCESWNVPPETAAVAVPVRVVPSSSLAAVGSVIVPQPDAPKQTAITQNFRMKSPLDIPAPRKANLTEIVEGGSAF